ncbi:MAG: LysR substrate-binding domain-containing protein, partial [Pseudomonadota bacterium]
MDTDAVHLFVRAADLRNISRAGRDLGLAPAAASAKLAKLERSLQTELLHRSTRRVSLSVDGAAFLPFARELLAQASAGRAAIGLGTADPVGTVRFTAPSTFAQRYIAPVLPVFLDRFPSLSLDLHLSDARFDLIDGSFDLALRTAQAEDAGFHGRRLCAEHYVLCAAPAYLERHGHPTDPAALSRHRLIGYRGLPALPLTRNGQPVGVFDAVRDGCRVVLDDGDSARQLTLAGAGISVQSTWNVADALASAALVEVLPDCTLASDAALWLVYPKSHVLSAKVRVLIDFLMSEIGDYPPW